MSDEVEIIDDKIMDYTFIMQDLERVQGLYEKVTQSELLPLNEEKKIISEIRNRVKIFKGTKDHDFIGYRKALEQQKRDLSIRVKSFEDRQDEYYDPHSNPLTTYKSISASLSNLKSMKEELATLNTLETFYNLKKTIITSLELKIAEFENMEELWRLHKQILKDGEELMYKPIKNIVGHPYTRSYEAARKKIEQSLKDQDLGALAKMIADKIDGFLQNLEVIQQINREHLRPADLLEINGLIERENSLQPGSIKCREMMFEKMEALSVAQLRQPISEVVFKAKK